jgi:hypothetical protein
MSAGRAAISNRGPVCRSELPIMTAYRQQARGAPRDLKPAIPDAPKILLHNVYGWFTRAPWREALRQWPRPRAVEPSEVTHSGH